jgi:phosphonoacetate hydrolase
LVSAIGEPPEIYPLAVNGWVVRAAAHLMARSPDELDVVYIATTDYAMHTHAPDEPESRRHMAIPDDSIGELVEAQPQTMLLITADHGMSQKTRMVDLRAQLSRFGIRGDPVPIIKDKYTVHHSNLGGSIFVYLDDPDDQTEAVKILGEVPGVEEAMPASEAASRFRLHPDRMGDVYVTGDPDSVFGDSSQVKMPSRLRSHASAHETRVPIIGHNGDFENFTFSENRDLGRFVHERVLG